MFYSVHVFHTTNRKTSIASFLLHTFPLAARSLDFKLADRQFIKLVFHSTIPLQAKSLDYKLADRQFMKPVFRSTIP